MDSTHRGIRVATIAAAAFALGVGPVGHAAGTEARVPELMRAGPVGVVQPTGMSDVVDVSKNGRYVLGRLGGRWVVRDLVRERTVRRLPSSASHRYHGISDTGRYVLYSYTPASGATACNEPWVRDRITNKARPAARTSKGRALPTGWAGAGGCPDEPSWTTQFTFSDPAISGNGRYVAFCANLQVVDRLDLYVKDMRTKRIRTYPGVCSDLTDAHETPAPPQISEDGRVILLPGHHATGDEAGYDVWAPAAILLNRSTLVGGAGGAHAQLTEDGSAVLSIGPMTCDGGWGPCSAGPKQPIRYDIASATTVALPAGDPGPAPTTRRGRFVVVVSRDAAGNHLAILDRATGALSDLTAAFAAAGVGVPSAAERTSISGDGRYVFVVSDAAGSTWVRMRWM